MPKLKICGHFNIHCKLTKETTCELEAWNILGCPYSPFSLLLPKLVKLAVVTATPLMGYYCKNYFCQPITKSIQPSIYSINQNALPLTFL